MKWIKNDDTRVFLIVIQFTSYFLLTKQLNCDEINVFQCSDGKCISRISMCDHMIDCPDRSDEDPTLCSTIQCKDHQFKCRTGICVDINKKCDDINDCGDNQDEEECNECHPNTVACLLSNECVLHDKICDGFEDCTDGTDEDDCPNFRSSTYENHILMRGKITTTKTFTNKIAEVMPITEHFSKNITSLSEKTTSSFAVSQSTEGENKSTKNVSIVERDSTIVIIVSVVLIAIVLISFCATAALVLYLNKKNKYRFKSVRMHNVLPPTPYLRVTDERTFNDYDMYLEPNYNTQLYNREGLPQNSSINQPVNSLNAFNNSLLNNLTSDNYFLNKQDKLDFYKGYEEVKFIPELDDITQKDHEKLAAVFGESNYLMPQAEREYLEQDNIYSAILSEYENSFGIES